MMRAVVYFPYVWAVFSGFAISGTAFGDGVSCRICNASSLRLVKGPRNLYPNVPLGENFSVFFKFTGFCSSRPDVVWRQAVGGSVSLPARRVSIKDSIYTATLNIVNTSRATYGLYGAYVCDKQLLNFTIVEPPPDCPTDPILPIPKTITAPRVVPNWGTRTVTIECFYWGDPSPSRYIDYWNNSAMILLDSNKYNTKRIDKKTCSFISVLGIQNVTTKDSGSYSCYAQPFVKQTTRSDNLTTQLSVIDFPKIMVSPKNTCIATSDHLVLQWVLSGLWLYVIPEIVVNYTKPLKNITSAGITIDGNAALDHFTVTVKITPGTLPVGRSSFQLFALLNTKTVSDVLDYNNEPNKSLITSVTVSDQVKTSEILKTALPSGGGLLILLVLCITVTVYCIRKRQKVQRRRRDYESLDRDVERDSPSWKPTSRPAGVTAIYYKNRKGLTADQFYERVLQFMDYLKLMSTDASGCQSFKCDFDGYHMSEHIQNWNNAIINWVQEANYILLILTPELHHCLTQSHDERIEMMGGSVSSSAITNLFSGPGSKSRSFIPVFLNVPFSPQLIPPSLNSNAFYEVHMENLNPEHGAEQQQAYLHSHQEEMSGLINLLRRLRQEM